MSAKGKEPPPKGKDAPKGKDDKGGKGKGPEPPKQDSCYEQCTGLPDWTQNLIYTIPLILAAPFIARWVKCRNCPQVQKAKPKPKPPPPKEPCCPPCCCPPCKPPEKQPPCKPPDKDCNL